MGDETPIHQDSYRRLYELQADQLALQPIQKGLFMDVTGLEYTGYGMDDPGRIIPGHLSASEGSDSWVEQVGTYNSNSQVLVFVDGAGHKWVGAASDVNRQALFDAGYRQGSIYVELCDGRYPLDEKLNAQYLAVINGDKKELRSLLKEDSETFVSTHRVQYDQALKQAYRYPKDPLLTDRGVQVTGSNVQQIDKMPEVEIMYGKGSDTLGIHGETLQETMEKETQELPISDPIVFAFRDKFIGLPRDNAPKYETNGLEELTHKLQSAQMLSLSEIRDLRLLLKLGLPYNYPWIGSDRWTTAVGTIGMYPEEVSEDGGVDQSRARYISMTRQVVRGLQEAVMSSNPELLRDREISCLIADLIKFTIQSGENLPHTIRESGYKFLEYMLTQEKLPEVINLACVRAATTLVLFPDAIKSVPEDVFIRILRLVGEKVETTLVENTKYRVSPHRFWIEEQIKTHLWGGNKDWEDVVVFIIQKSNEIKERRDKSSREELILKSTRDIVSRTEKEIDFDLNSWFVQKTRGLAQ